jgi:selenide,water dikinase
MGLAAADLVPGGTRANLEYVQDQVDFAESVSTADKFLLADAQTSGGLLLSVAAERAEEALQLLDECGVSSARVIGTVTRQGSGRLTVKR